MLNSVYSTELSFSEWENFKIEDSTVGESYGDRCVLLSNSGDFIWEVSYIISSGMELWR